MKNERLLKIIIGLEQFFNSGSEVQHECATPSFGESFHLQIKSTVLRIVGEQVLYHL